MKKYLVIGLTVMVIIGGVIFYVNRNKSSDVVHNPVVTTEQQTTEKKTTEKKTTEKKTTEKETTERRTTEKKTTEQKTTEQRTTQATTERPNGTQPSTQAPKPQPSTQTSNNTQTTRPQPSTQAAPTQAPVTTEHNHNWVPVYRTESHSFCRVCHMDLSAAGQTPSQHSDASGTYPVDIGGTIFDFPNCSGTYSGGVQVLDHYECGSCGATK